MAVNFFGSKSLKQLAVMKRLILLRHGSASLNHFGSHDFERELNESGKQETKTIAQRLMQRGVQVDLIVSSPALRAHKTAELLAEAIGYPKHAIRKEPSFYEATAEDLMSFARCLNGGSNSVLICGHNPSLAYLIDVVAKGGIHNYPTCCMACLEFPVNNWVSIDQKEARLRFFETPHLP
jgi:phosphohistidine phosphatase